MASGHLPRGEGMNRADPIHHEYWVASFVDLIPTKAFSENVVTALKIIPSWSSTLAFLPVHVVGGD